ncbi:MAG: acetyl-CoA carboxylase biotin carboxyl carrier protein [Bacteroidota bacterium]|nr:acetyl-CoA carboxylase biotin carboxyl carrier protein [Bacteroidota bacterium]
MDINEIQALIKFVAKSGVSEVELETKGFKIVIKTPKTEQVMMQQAPMQMVQAAPLQAMAPVQQTQATQATTPAETPANEESKYIEIKSPMIGTFYRSAGPDKPSFINVGDEINAGKVICIIEAMKLFNEIESDIKGRIVKVLVEDGKPVEYDQVLFLVEPA